MKDLILDSDKDLKIENGDFVIDESTLQNQELLLLSSKGDWKENPTVGIGAAGFLKDQDKSGLLSEMKSELEKDGMNVKSIDVDITNGKIQIDADY